MKKIVLIIAFCFSGAFACGGCVDSALPGMTSQKSQLLYDEAEANLALNIQKLNSVLRQAIVLTENNNRILIEQNLALQKQNLIDKEKGVFIKEQQNAIQSIINSIKSN